MANTRGMSLSHEAGHHRADQPTAARLCPFDVNLSLSRPRRTRLVNWADRSCATASNVRPSPSSVACLPVSAYLQWKRTFRSSPEAAGTLRPPCQIRLFRLVWLVRFVWLVRLVRLVWLLRLVGLVWLFRIHVFSFPASEEAQVPFGHQDRQLRAWSELTVCGVGAYMQNTPP